MTATVWDHLENPVRRKRVRVGVKRDDAPTERKVQRAILKAVRKLGMFVAAVPNGAHLAGGDDARMHQMSALKADGLVVGFPDLIVFSRDGVACLEVKKEGGVVSDDQLRVHASLKARGCMVACVCTVDEALAALRLWGWIAQ